MGERGKGVYLFYFRWAFLYIFGWVAVYFRGVVWGGGGEKEGKQGEEKEGYVYVLLQLRGEGSYMVSHGSLQNSIPPPFFRPTSSSLCNCNYPPLPGDGYIISSLGAKLCAWLELVLA